jgi:DNA gyrase subunit A
VAPHAGAVELPGQHARDPRRPPETLTLRDIIESVHPLPRGSDHPPLQVRAAKARERAHILLGLVVAVTNLDEVVKLIRGSASPAEAREKLLAREWPGEQIRPTSRWSKRSSRRPRARSYKLSEAQVKAILELASTA